MFNPSKISVVEHRLFPPNLRAIADQCGQHAAASKYRPGRGLNQGKGDTTAGLAGSGCCAHSRRGCRVRYNNEKLVRLADASIATPSPGRLVPVATSSVRLVGSTVTERLGWLAGARPGDPCQGPWLAGAGQCAAVFHRQRFCSVFRSLHFSARQHCFSREHPLSGASKGSGCPGWNSDAACRAGQNLRFHRCRPR